MPDKRSACSICGYSYGQSEEESLKTAGDCEAKGLTEKPVCSVGDRVEVICGSHPDLWKEIVTIKRIYPDTCSHRLCYSFTSREGRSVYAHRDKIVGVITVVPVTQAP